MSRSEVDSGGPPAIIHKRILDAAEANPDASLEGIAENVTGASIELVERVLEEYGDPGDESDDVSEAGDQLDSSDGYESGTGEHMSKGEPTEEPTVESNGSEQAAGDATDPNAQTADRSELSDKQVGALRRIRANPDATQRELAEKLDVTAATVSRWLNDIPGFAWEQRQQFASRVLNGTSGTIREDGPGETERGNREATKQERGLERSIKDHEYRIEALERVTEKTCEGGTTATLDADLLHKTIHACMASEQIAEAEELRIIQQLIGEDGNRSN